VNGQWLQKIPTLKKRCGQPVVASLLDSISFQQIPAGCGISNVHTPGDSFKPCGKKTLFCGSEPLAVKIKTLNVLTALGGNNTFKGALRMKER